MSGTSPFSLPNTWVVSIPIVEMDAAGTVVPMIGGDTFTAVSSNPASLNSVVGFMADGTTPAAIVNALVVASPGLTVTLNDSAGLPQVVYTFDIIDDLTPVGDALDLANATHTTQARPTAPGP